MASGNAQPALERGEGGGGSSAAAQNVLSQASAVLAELATVAAIAGKIEEAAALAVGAITGAATSALGELASEKNAALAAIRAAQGRGAYSNADNPNFQNPADMGYSSDRPQISPVLTE